MAHFEPPTPRGSNVNSSKLGAFAAVIGKLRPDLTEGACVDYAFGFWSAMTSRFLGDPQTHNERLEGAHKYACEYVSFRTPPMTTEQKQHINTAYALIYPAKSNPTR